MYNKQDLIPTRFSNNTELDIDIFENHDVESLKPFISRICNSQKTVMNYVEKFNVRIKEYESRFNLREFFKYFEILLDNAQLEKHDLIELLEIFENILQNKEEVNKYIKLIVEMNGYECDEVYQAEEYRLKKIKEIREKVKQYCIDNQITVLGIN